MSLSKAAIASFDVDAQKSFTPLCPNELPVAGGDGIGAELNYMASLAGHRIGSKDAHTPTHPGSSRSTARCCNPPAWPMPM